MNRPVTRRLYKFVSSEFALFNIKNRQLILTRFTTCNDPFELAPFDLSDRNLRRQHKQWKDHVDHRNGILCFCGDWQSPVLWAHYAENYKGLCLGFDVTSDCFMDVDYASERLYPKVTLENFFDFVGEDQIGEIIATKFHHWSYEEEVRLLIPIDPPVPPDTHVFHSYSDTMVLKQVIIGPDSDFGVDDVRAVVRDEGVEIIPSRFAFQNFSIVRQKNQKKWK